jgi:hypothetical protein
MNFPFLIFVTIAIKALSNLLTFLTKNITKKLFTQT